MKSKEASGLQYPSGMPPRIEERFNKIKAGPEYLAIKTANQIGPPSSLKARVLFNSKVNKLQCTAASVCYSHLFAASIPKSHV